MKAARVNTESFSLERDDRGDFCRFIVDDGRFVTIDPDDLPHILHYRCRILNSSRTERCQYVVRARPKGGTILIHREIMDAPKGLTIDHGDGNGLNDRRYNLRLATVQQNNSNRVHPKRGRSGYRGVYPSTTSGRWYVIISLDDHKHHLGSFADPIVAARVFDAAAIAARGEFTQLNFPPASYGR